MVLVKGTKLQYMMVLLRLAAGLVFPLLAFIASLLDDHDKQGCIQDPGMSIQVRS